MNQTITKNILSVVGLDETITEILANQKEILECLDNIQEAQKDDINILNKNIIAQQEESFFNKKIYYVLGVILFTGILYYFFYGGGDTSNFQSLENELIKIMEKKTRFMDRYIEDIILTITRNNDHLVDVIQKLYKEHNAHLNRMLYQRIFSSIITNTRHLEDLSMALKNANLISSTADTAAISEEARNLARVIFSDEVEN